MRGSTDAAFKRELKALVIRECDLKVSPDDLPDDAPLFGPGSPLALDSLDALQISVAIRNAYGAAIVDSKEMRRVSISFDSLADHIRPA